MIKILLRPKGVIRRYAEEREIVTPAMTTASDVTRALGIPPQLKMVFLVNGRRTAPDQPLNDGDELTLVTLLCGG